METNLKTRRAAPMLAIALGAVAAVGAGCGGENEFVEPPPPAVTVAHPAQREITKRLEFSGRTAAVETVEIRARVEGFLQTVDLPPSDIVEEGALLFTIDDAPFKAVVAAAQADVAKRNAELDLADVTLLRTREAHAKGAVSEIELAGKVAERDAADALLKAAEAALVAAEIDLSYTVIKAPLRGRVSRKLVSVGNLVGRTDATLLTTIVQDDPLDVYFQVNERLIVQILGDNSRNADRDERPQREVYLTLADGTKYETPGIIDFGENTVDPKFGTLLVRAKVPNPDGRLFAGLFARISMPYDTVKAVLVPERALQRDLTGPYLLVVDAEGMVSRRDVVLGPLEETERVIESGVTPEDRVIIDGLQRARAGIKVSAGEARDEPAAPTAGAGGAGDDESGAAGAGSGS